MLPEKDEPVNPIERMQEQARVESFPRLSSKPAGPEAMEGSRQNIARWLDESKVPAADLARMAGVSCKTLSRVLAGAAERETEAILRRAEAAIVGWLDHPASATGARFVMTRIAREVLAVVKVTSKQRGIGVLCGGSGYGKSMAVDAVIRLHFQNGILLEVNAGCRAPLHLLNALIQAEQQPLSRSTARRAGSCGFGQNVAKAFNRLVDRLADSGRLVLIDEADNLENPGFNIIRQLHDATRCPVVLVGRPPLLNKIANTARDSAIGGSFIGRVCVQHILKPTAGAGGDRGGPWLFSVEEIMAMLDQYKVRYTSDAARWLCALANISAIEGQLEGGALRFAIKVWELAITLDPRPDPEREIAAPLLRQANALLRGHEWGHRADQVIQNVAMTTKAAG